MRHRLVIALVAVLALAQAASANPLSRTWHYMGHHKRFFIMEGVAIGAAGINAYGLHHCRRLNGVEPCQEHYGSAWGFYGFMAGMNVIAFPALAESCWKDGQGKFCYALGYGGSATQLGIGIRQWNIRTSRESHESLLPKR